MTEYLNDEEILKQYEDQERYVIKLAIDVNRFLESKIGTRITSIALSEINDLRIDLENVNPEDVTKIRDIQNKIKVRRMFFDYLSEIVEDGQKITQEMIDNEIQLNEV